jgi:hypothetical protein
MSRTWIALPQGWRAEDTALVPEQSGASCALEV